MRSYRIVRTVSTPFPFCIETKKWGLFWCYLSREKGGGIFTTWCEAEVALAKLYDYSA